MNKLIEEHKPIVNQIKEYLISAHDSAKQAHDSIAYFKKLDENEKNLVDNSEFSGIVYLNKATGSVSAAYALYQYDSELFDRQIFHHVFDSFFRYIDQYLRDFSERSNYQQENISWGEFLDFFNQIDFDLEKILI